MNRIGSFFRRQLDPSECWGALLFGLIMVLIITLGAHALVKEGRDAMRDMLAAMVGCNVAWGVIQGWLFVLEATFERGRVARVVCELQEARDEEQALAVIRNELDPDLERVANEEERARLYRHILVNVRNAQMPRTRLSRDDMAGAITVFLLVSLTTVPAVVPFLLIDHRRTALRVSNLLLVSLLFLVGYQWAGITNTNRWRAGLTVMIVGLVMVAIGEALGG
jgi:hypothetical protein